MKVRYRQTELFIEPETEFEEQVLSRYHNCEAYLKCGLSLTDVQGILIKQKGDEDEIQEDSDRE
jgi:hypothetical protein